MAVNFSDVILSDQNESRKLIVSVQKAMVATKLTDRLIKQLDILKKTQNVSYTGTGCFVVDLDNLRTRPRKRSQFESVTLICRQLKSIRTTLS